MEPFEGVFQLGIVVDTQQFLVHVNPPTWVDPEQVGIVRDLVSALMATGAMGCLVFHAVMNARRIA